MGRTTKLVNHCPSGSCLTSWVVRPIGPPGWSPGPSGPIYVVANSWKRRRPRLPDSRRVIMWSAKADFGLGCSHGATAATENSLAAAWLYDWAWGQLRSASLQRYAAAAVRSGFRNDLIVRIASLGAGGVHSRNMTRQLMQWTGKVQCRLRVHCGLCKKRGCDVDRDLQQPRVRPDGRS